MSDHTASQPASATGTDIAQPAMTFFQLVAWIIQINETCPTDHTVSDQEISALIANAIEAHDADRFAGQYALWLEGLELEVYQTFEDDEPADDVLLAEVCDVSRLDGALAMIDNHGYDSPVSSTASDRLFALAIAAWPGHTLYNGAEFGREFNAVQHLKDN